MSWIVIETPEGQIMKQPGITIIMNETGVHIATGSGLLRPMQITWDEMNEVMRGIIRTKRKGAAHDNSSIPTR